MRILLVALCLCLEGDPRELLRDPDPERRVRGVRLLGRENSLEAAKALLGLHRDPHLRVRTRGLEALAGISDPSARAWLAEEGLAHGKATGRRMAARAVGRMRNKAAAPGLIRLLRDGTPSVRAAAAAALGRLGAEGAADGVAGLLRRDPSWEVRAEAAGALALIRSAEAVADLRAALRDRDPRVRLGVLEALEVADADEGRRAAIDALSDPEWTVRCTASEILARIGGKEAVGPLIAALGSAKGRTIRDTWSALRRITGRRLGADGAAWKTWWEANGASWSGPKGSPGEAGPSSMERVTYYDIPIWSDRIVFVMDLSESMKEASRAGGGRTRADEARGELKAALGGLPPSSRFNVIRFRTEPEQLSPRPLRPTGKARAASLRWIDVPRGGTNLHDALEMALRSGGGDTVFLLSDGAPSCGTFRNKTEILQSVRRLNRYRKVRIHTIGIGSQMVSPRWGGLLEALAAATDGESVTRK